MDKSRRDAMAASIRSFRLPRYEEIPNVGLYLEQTAKYINEYLLPLQGAPLTGSMISNYVKKRLVSNPVKKQYDREQIAYLLFIAVVKGVLSLDNIGVLLTLQRQHYDSAQAYNYFCSRLEQALRAVFGLGEEPCPLEPDAEDAKLMLQTAVVAAAHKIYLDKCFDALRPTADEPDAPEKRKAD